MKILNKYIRNDIKLNKKRSISLIIGIAMSTMLICSILIISMSFYETFYNDVKVTKGNYHNTFFRVEDKEIITNNEEIESYFVTQEKGYVNLPESDGREYIAVLEFDEKALNNYGLKLIEGRMPKNTNEIIISNEVIENGKINYYVGQTVDFEINKIKLDENNVLTQRTTYLKKMKEEGRIQEEFIEKKEYKIVGIIQRPNEAIESYKAAGYTAITLMDGIQDNAGYSVRFKNANKALELAEKLAQDNNLLYNTNYDLLNYEGGSEEFNFVSAIAVIVIVMIIVLIVCSVLIIKCGFDILISEKIKQYSVLSCIGAGKKQIKKLALIENIIIGTIGIIIGIIVSIFLTAILIIGISNMTSTDSISEIKMIYKVPIWIIILSILLSYITVYFANKRAIKKLNSISPIVNTRVELDDIENTKKTRIERIIKKIFGIGGVIAYKNIKRNQKKYNSVTNTLIISICMIIGINVFVSYTQKLAVELYEESEYNVLIGYKSYEEQEVKYKKLLEISDNPYIDKYTLSRGKMVFLDLKEHILEKDMEFYLSKCTRDDKISDIIIVLGKQEYKDYINEIGANYEECKDGIIWKNDIRTYMSDGNKKVKLLNLKKGDTLNIETLEEGEKKSFKISYVTDKAPMGYENTTAALGTFIMSDELFDKTFNKYQVNFLAVKTNNAQALCKYIEKNHDELLARNMELEIEKERQTVHIISIILYGIIGIVIIIAITNMYNIINSNTKLRKKEFAMLKSIGMTKKEFKNLQYLESIFYCIKSIIFGTILGVIINIIIYYFANQIDVVKLIIPVKLMIIVNLLVIVFVIIIQKYSFKNMNLENIIENIRNENI